MFDKLTRAGLVFWLGYYLLLITIVMLTVGVEVGYIFWTALGAITALSWSINRLMS